MSQAARGLPMFPLNAVFFPGMQTTLHVFEERYRALVTHLMDQPDPAQRVLGTVFIREGYEVGARGNQSLMRVGCRLQLTDLREHADGSFDADVVGRDRFRIDDLHTDGRYPLATFSSLHDVDDATTAEIDAEATMARDAFGRYREVVTQLRGDPISGDMPADPTALSWLLAAGVSLPMGQRQHLLETTSLRERLCHLGDLIRDELRAIKAIASLPATELARTAWSPN